MNLKYGSFFSGFGGFDIPAHKMGWEIIFNCEIDPFPRQILKYYWPNTTQHENIITTDFTIYRGKIDILTGGFPCQPFSLAGKGKGNKDSRSLWPQMYRAIREIKPRWVVAENVPGLISRQQGIVFEQIQSDLEIEGYEVLPLLLSAESFGFDHLRERLWIIAYANSFGCQNIQTRQGKCHKKNAYQKRDREEIKQR